MCGAGRIAAANQARRVNFSISAGSADPAEEMCFSQQRFAQQTETANRLKKHQYDKQVAVPLHSGGLVIQAVTTSTAPAADPINPVRSRKPLMSTANATCPCGGSAVTCFVAEQINFAGQNQRPCWGSNRADWHSAQSISSMPSPYFFRILQPVTKLQQLPSATASFVSEPQSAVRLTATIQCHTMSQTKTTLSPEFRGIQPSITKRPASAILRTIPRGIA